MTVGERIKQRRIELDLSQDELAKKVGYKSRSSIQKIESARNLPLPKVEKMAVALECTPSFFMGWEETENERVAIEHLMNAYVQNAEAKEFIDLFQSASPDVQKTVVAFLKSAQHDS